MAAWGQAMVATDEARPNSCLCTYVLDRFTYWDSPGLARFVPGIEIDGKVHWASEAKNVRVEDFPGGVQADFELAGVKVTTRIIPLTVGREAKTQEGAVVYEITTSPRTPVIVRCGGSALVSMVSLTRTAWMRQDTMGAEGDSASVEDGVGMLASTVHPLKVAVTSTTSLVVEKGDSGQVLGSRFADGKGSILVSFVTDAARAKQIAATDHATATRQVSDYYSKLLRARIQTPDKTLDQAFAAAIVNLEYNWLPPYGWVEAIHHWLAMWHMQDTAAAEWIGQADRSRLCNVTLAEHLLPDGSVPQFVPSGMTRKDFGGSNQFFAWQLRHYFNFTRDLATIKRLAPVLDKVIAQTFEQYDPDHDGLLAWGQQIGNQEDYVATPYNGTTPSVEGINMLRTGAEFARALGQPDKAREYDARADAALARLRSELWQSDLGCFAYYKDPFGEARIDGQYHTLIYPVIWGALDPLDSYTSIRHLRDRLIDADGQTYLSNLFPSHWPGTWGMQTGVAQQPWAAWGLAAVGLRDEAVRPLMAAAKWTMNPDHRGSWPEISTESTPAYFSAPAGLFIQSTIEAIFGLRVHGRILEISPCFPDKWRSSRLDLPGFSAVYSKQGNSITYAVTTEKSMRREVRWQLPACRVVAVTANGKPARFLQAPAVDGVIVSLSTVDEKITKLRIDYSLLHCRIDHAGSVAEGDALELRASGCEIERVDDRCGVLSSTSLGSKTTLTGKVRTGLLAPYMGFGRLGEMDFSRRTFFVLVNATGIRFWKPVDVTVLPRYECAGVGDVADGARVLVRNNTAHALRGEAVLMAARGQFRFNVDVPARSERQYTVDIPANLLSLFSPGSNRAKVLLPGAREIEIDLIASKLIEGEPKLREVAAGRIAHVSLASQKLVADTQWRDTRDYPSYGHQPWASSKPPMESLQGKSEVSVPGLPVVTFELQDRKYAPVSWKSGQPEVTVDLNMVPCKKLYLLVVPFLDNHDTYSTVGRVDARAENGAVMSRTLRFPGDLDWWSPQEVVWDFSTARKDHPDRFALLSRLAAKDGDWAEAKPPAFPQPEYWATCLPLKTPSSVMNVIELDFGRPMSMKSVTLSVIGADPAFGLVAVSAETAGGDALLAGTKWMPPPSLREPRMVFSFDRPGDLMGWRTEGEAFSVAAVPVLFKEVTLNSLAKSGESVTGKAISPDFTIGADDTQIVFRMQGGNSLADEGPGCLSIRLVDSKTGDVLERMPAMGNCDLREGRMPVDKWRGRTVHLELIDLNTATSWAWLGLQKVALTAE